MPTPVTVIRKLTSMRGIAPPTTGYSGFLVALFVIALVCVLLALLLPTLAAVILLISCFVVLPLVYLSRTSSAESAAHFRRRWLARAAGFHLARVGRGRPRYLNTGVVEDAQGNLYGTGMAIIRHRLFMMDRGRTAEIPWGSVRGWSAGDGSTVVIETGADDSSLAPLEVGTGGGIVLQVRDIGHPVWRFETSDPAVIARWREILMRIDEADARTTRF